MCDEFEITGCTNPEACNYSLIATDDDSSCNLPDGCTDEIACNYDPTAEIDDNSCIYQACTGCMEPAACNYDPNALITDGSCEYESCVGCTDLEACNYSEIATEDDGSCEYAELYYDCDGNCIDDLDGDLICDQFEVCLLYTSPSPRDMRRSRMPSSA